MENFQSEESSLFTVNFDDNTKQQMKGAATMGGIAAIISIVASAVGVVNYIVQHSRPAPVVLEGFGNSDLPRSGDNIVYTVLSFGVSILLFYFLFRFSTRVKNGVSGNSSTEVTTGLAALANYFKTIGILLIIVISLFTLGILALVMTAGIK